MKPATERALTRGWAISLRSRIALYYTVATAILIALIFSLIYLMVDRIVYGHLDRALAHEARQFLRKSEISPIACKGLERIDTDDDDDENHGNMPAKRRRPLRTEFIQLSLPDGNPYWRSPNLGLSELDLDPLQKARLIHTTRVEGVALRQLQIPLKKADGSVAGWLLVARPVRDAETVLGDLQRVMLLSFPAILLTLFALTRTIAGRSIRPVEEVIRSAETITREHLDRRIPLPRNQDELFRLSLTLNALLQRLQEAFQREKQFTADASHELKTPLAAVMGTLEVLLRKPRTQDHYQARIRSALAELERMNRLVEQLLMLARYEGTREVVESRSILLEDAIHTVIARTKGLAEERRISVVASVPVGCQVQADEGLLGQMLENILTNALKYAPEGTKVEISAACHEDKTTCSIMNQGEGIPEELLDAVFERFYRVDESRNSASGGSGLGLAIVKKLADLQGIALSLASEPGRETLMTLTWKGH